MLPSLPISSSSPRSPTTLKSTLLLFLLTTFSTLAPTHAHPSSSLSSRSAISRRDTSIPWVLTCTGPLPPSAYSNPLVDTYLALESDGPSPLTTLCGDHRSAPGGMGYVCSPSRRVVPGAVETDLYLAETGAVRATQRQSEIVTACLQRCACEAGPGADGSDRRDCEGPYGGPGPDDVGDGRTTYCLFDRDCDASCGKCVPLAMEWWQILGGVVGGGGLPHVRYGICTPVGQ